MKIVIADSMESEVVEEIKKLGNVAYKPANLKEALKDADVLVVRSATQVNQELIANSQKLKIVARAGSGLDNIDSDACQKRNIKIINTPGAGANAVAELTVGLMITMLRNVQKAHTQMKNKIWDKSNLLGKEISGKTIGIVGFGRIGLLVAQKSAALGMRVISYDPKPYSAKGFEFVSFVSLEELLEKADIISLHTILTDDNKNMINDKTIAKMKDGVYIINIARGELVDENALYEACRSKKITAAALDVYRKEPYSGRLLELDNVCLTPHLGASTKEAQLRIGKELVDKLKTGLCKTG